MNLARLATIAMGLASVAALLGLGPTLGHRRIPTPDAERRMPSAGPACGIVVAEHAACALPPRQDRRSPPSSGGQDGPAQRRASAASSEIGPAPPIPSARSPDR